jgi:hypothetical protein
MKDAVLILLGLLQLIVLPILGWALMTIVNHKSEIATLKSESQAAKELIIAHKQDMSDRLDELRKDLGKIFAKLDDLGKSFAAGVLRRRSSDQDHEEGQ